MEIDFKENFELVTQMSKPRDWIEIKKNKRSKAIGKKSPAKKAFHKKVHRPLNQPTLLQVFK